MRELSLLTWNIGNPSSDRAQRQLEWLANRPEDVLVLTETKASAGCQLLADAFLGSRLRRSPPEPGSGRAGHHDRQPGDPRARRLGSSAPLPAITGLLGGGAHVQWTGPSDRSVRAVTRREPGEDGPQAGLSGLLSKRTGRNARQKRPDSSHGRP